MTNVISESGSDDDIINSSNEIYPTPLKMNRDKSKIEMKFKDLSLIEPSDSDNDSSAHYKSTIASSNESRPFFEDLKFLNTTHSTPNPICQSSILEKPKFENYSQNVSITTKNKKGIEIITLDEDSPKRYPITIDLTKSEYNNPKNDSKPSVADGNFKSLKMEKLKLEEIVKRHSMNIDNMKVS